MGRVFIEEALIKTGIDRPNIIMVCTYLVRSKQAKDAADAIRKLEEGVFNKVDIEEEMSEAHRMAPDPVFDEDLEKEIDNDK